MSARALLALALLSALAGCAKDLSELAPYPCALDQTCPLGLVCVPGVGCTAAKLDGLCSAETDCTQAGGACRLGICAPSCEPACPEGRVCAKAGEGEACAVECGDGGACPAGLECKDLWYGGRRGCLRPELTPSACLATVPQPKPQCAKESFNVPCGGGKFCAANSTCLSNGTSCECNSGYLSWSCANDQRCSASNKCTYPNWWCLPEGLTSTCASTPSFQPALYQCADGRELRASCETSCQSACEDTRRCDPLRQTCGYPDRPKCSFADTDAGTVVTVCVPVSGAVPVGGSCTRDLSTPEAIDDCAAGGVCTTLGAPAGLFCRGFCSSTNGCDAGFHCVPISEPPRVGMCSPDCALFSDCGPAATCGPDWDFDDYVTARCREASGAAPGTSCVWQSDCGAFQVCALGTDGGEECAALCDPDHPCDAGACTAFGDSKLPAGAGFCR
ncbi:MAG: hypothetical protein ACYC8T_11455 [Myxococcaceae bacterium]